MKKSILAILLVTLFVVSTSFAGFDEGSSAYQAGNYKQAFTEWKPLADQGDASAQYNLGVMYDKGQGVPQDYKQAVDWYSKSAAQGNSTGQAMLGAMYYNGQGVPQDHKQAAAWFSKAAEQGDASAQSNLGVMYENGQGVPQDYKQAVEWYRKAADQGYATAQYNLGVMYGNGQGVPQDYKQAVAWYSKAAEQGDASAQSNLGVMYGNGQGVPQSHVVAYAIFNLSAANDPSENNMATKNRLKLADEMTTKEIVAAQNLTRDMAKPGNFLKALDLYVKHPAVKEKTIRKAETESTVPVAAAPSDFYPARPAKRAGMTTCNTSCMNADCRRTYDDGRKVRFKAKQKWNPFNNAFEWDSGTC